MDNNYNDILEDLDILWANHNPHDLENQKDLDALSNLIVDMTLNGASKEEIKYVVEYSMDAMDCLKEGKDFPYNERVEDLRHKYKSRESLLYDQIEHIKGRVIELQKQLGEEKSKAMKMQIMIETLLHKLGKNVIYDALGIEEEVEKDD